MEGKFSVPFDSKRINKASRWFILITPSDHDISFTSGILLHSVLICIQILFIMYLHFVSAVKIILQYLPKYKLPAGLSFEFKYNANMTN